jgi:hypothetical protein
MVLDGLCGGLLQENLMGRLRSIKHYFLLDQVGTDSKHANGAKSVRHGSLTMSICL